MDNCDSNIINVLESDSFHLDKGLKPKMLLHVVFETSLLHFPVERELTLWIRLLVFDKYK